jgi:hypothetical protein
MANSFVGRERSGDWGREYAPGGKGSQEESGMGGKGKKEILTQRRRVRREEGDEEGNVVMGLGLGVRVATVKEAARRRTPRGVKIF